MTLAANTSYYLVSQEFSGGDQWCYSNTTVTTTTVAQCQSGAYQFGSWGTQGAANNTYGPVNFKYCASPISESIAAPAHSSGAYADWLAAYPSISGTVSAPEADPDGDRLCNLVEYVLGADPLQSSPCPDIFVFGGRLALTFPLNTAATDATRTVQGSGNPTGPWTDLARSVNGANITGLLDGVSVSESGAATVIEVTVSDHIPIAPAHRQRFMRLVVTR